VHQQLVTKACAVCAARSVLQLHEAAGRDHALLVWELFYQQCPQHVLARLHCVICIHGCTVHVHVHGRYRVPASRLRAQCDLSGLVVSTIVVQGWWCLPLEVVDRHVRTLYVHTRLVLCVCITPSNVMCIMDALMGTLILPAEQFCAVRIVVICCVSNFASGMYRRNLIIAGCQ
jgi:hypothetical protein